MRAPASPLEICQANADDAKRRKAKLREDFPFAVQIVNELKAEGLDPRVIWMREGDKEWHRGESA